MRACLFAIIATMLGCSVQPTPWPQTTATDDDDMELWADGGAAFIDSQSTEGNKETAGDTEEEESEWVEHDSENDSQSTAIQQPIDSETEGSDETDTGVEQDTEFECLDDLECNTRSLGMICCDNRCINPLGNPEHCGSCKNACIAEDDCVMGLCRDGLDDGDDTASTDTDTCEPCEQYDPPNGIDDDCDGWIDENENDPSCEEE